MLQYSILIEWSATDHAYLATFHDLPECKAQGDTYEEAARNGREALETFREAAKERNEELPEPTNQKSMREQLDEMRAEVHKLKGNIIQTNNGVACIEHEGRLYRITFE